MSDFKGFCHEKTMYTVYSDNTAQSFNGTPFVRHQDGQWVRKDGVALEPSLQAAFQEAYRALMGQVAS